MRILCLDWHATVVGVTITLQGSVTRGKCLSKRQQANPPFLRIVSSCHDRKIRTSHAKQSCDRQGMKFHLDTRLQTMSSPPSVTACTAPSINGAAVPYGSRSTTSTRLF